MERDFTFQGKNFKLNKIDAFKQFHIVRRIAPILSDLIPALGAAAKTMKTEGLSESEKFEEFGKIATPIMSGLSKLSDDDSNKVLFGLLSAVEIQQDGGNWAKVVSDNQLMFSNLDLPCLLNAAGKSFMFNMTGFFNILPQASPGKG